MAPYNPPKARPSLIGFLIKVMLLLSFGAACLFLAVHHHGAWLIIVSLVVLNGVWMAQGYAEEVRC
ncbi:hypothetical protein [Candidatus Viridilinea mediisalina]|uniref:Uncharacterized protein n=1 Tax=Candidatus Viridilinea mediisalina TaxID=2024553 RepID=A0A2A6RK25_9CHLR|nr:hypothetical protein [Candidatus Viridilinea mediisalina]PDW03372.1 hypothetical protein CJ255_09305 [Candidatus Viridilinea mediisalina]